MASLFETIQRWADGQNGLNAREPIDREALQAVARRLVMALRRFHSLAELASGYYAEDLARRVGEEFGVSPSEIDLLRNAAYWQRFMEIRHPETIHTFEK